MLAFFLIAYVVLFLLIIIFLLIFSDNFKKHFTYTFLFFIAIFFLLKFIHRLNSRTILYAGDLRGDYVIDRNMFAGTNADWQYETFRFTVKNNDSLYFYVTSNHNKVLNTYTGKVNMHTEYVSDRMEFVVGDSTHPILKEQPCIYRSTWSYYVVLYSPVYGNMFFIKDRWWK